MTRGSNQGRPPLASAQSAVIKREETGVLTVRPWRVLAGVGADDRGAVAGRGVAETESQTSLNGSERLVQTCRSLAAALHRERDGLLEALGPHLTHLIFAAAEIVIRREASTDPALIERTVAEALAATSQAATVTVRVASGQVAQVEQVFASHDCRVRVIADDGVAAGGCVVATDWGDIDATLETQMSGLREALHGNPSGTSAA